MRHRVTGYIVFERGQDYEQALHVKQDDRKFPPGGVLDWCTSGRTPATLFFTHQDARAAINRTEHYCKAFGVPQDGSTDSLPAKKDCYIKPVAVAR